MSATSRRTSVPLASSWVASSWVASSLLALALPALGAACQEAPSAGAGPAASSPVVDASASAPMADRPDGAPGVSAIASASSAAAPSPSAAAPAPSPPPRPAPRPDGLPTIPEGESPRPTLDEWRAAPTVLEARGCTASVLREWVRVRCADSLWMRSSDWGRPGADYREDLMQGSIEGRLRKGALLRATSANAGVTFVMAWPTTDDQPWRFTLEGPRLDARPEPWPAPGPVPDVPLDDMPRPPEANWMAARPVNTAARDTPTRDCGLLVSGQWARLHCRPPGDLASLRAWEVFTGFGAKKTDHVESMVGIVGSELQLDFRLRRGGRAHGMAIWAGNGRRASVKYEWPDGAPRPTVLSLVEIEAAAPDP